MSKLQNYLNFFLSRAEISRIRPSVFKCQSLKYFVSLWGSSQSKLQNYLNFFLSRAEISRIRPSVFKCQSLKYFVSLWGSSQYYFDSFTLIRNNGHDKRSSRRHEGALEPHPGLSVSLAARGSRPDHRSARASRHHPRRDRPRSLCA